MPNLPLKRGSKGIDVEELQEHLLRKGYDLSRYGTDGDYGEETESAVKSLQLDSGLPVTGIVDLKTWNALISGLPSQKGGFNKNLIWIGLLVLVIGAVIVVATTKSGGGSK